MSTMSLRVSKRRNNNNEPSVKRERTASDVQMEAFVLIRFFCNMASKEDKTTARRFPLQQAAWSGSLKDVLDVLEHGPAFVEKFRVLSEPFAEQLSIGNDLPAHEEFCRSNHLQYVQSIAAMKGKLDVLEYLLSKGVDMSQVSFFNRREDCAFSFRDIVFSQKEGNTCSPLFYGIQNRRLDVVRFCVEKGNCDVNTTVSCPFYHTRSVLMVAIDIRDVSIVDYLISSGANVDFRGGCGNTPLSNAVFSVTNDKPKFGKGREEEKVKAMAIISLLLSNGAKATDDRSADVYRKQLDETYPGVFVDRYHLLR